jgi:hypothetical protein
MTPLRQQIIDQMTVRGMAEKTKRAYLQGDRDCEVLSAGVDPFQWTHESHTGRSQSWGKPRRGTRRSFAGRWSNCIGLADRCASWRRSSAARRGRLERGSSTRRETRAEATAA